ncbi:hypothetical protein [Cohnella abietis]|uniref:Uncharacterized protein n=1 Tax=Cohnella abietis TaxID=2507935 RepID=A0A3T1D1A8_9BACL|nr:hypothetical protein [Cohnella abietis]BBI31902.1 hypothetical protein KCTCHS21_13010 [Cohnella abietis]
MLSLLSGCSNSSNQEIVGDLQKQITEKNNEIDSLKSNVNTLQTEINSLSTELDEIKNGALKQLVTIKNSFENEQYQDVISKAKTLHENFNGSPEDKEAQELAKSSIDKLNKIKAEKKAEEDKKKAEAAKGAQEKARAIIRVSKVYPGKPNSADGVDLYIHWTNKSNKTIKYIYFDVVPINAVGDIVSSDIGGRSTFRAKDTGPIKSGVSFGSEYYWENAWYNSTIKKVQLQQIDITYMDDSSDTISGDDIKYIQY